jgi:O-antigen ligase
MIALAALIALALGAGVAVAGPRWGPLLGGAPLLLLPLLAVAFRHPGVALAGLALLIPLQVRLNLPGGLSLAVGFLVISALAAVAAYRELLGEASARNGRREAQGAGREERPPSLAGMLVPSPPRPRTSGGRGDPCSLDRTASLLALALTLFVGAALLSLGAAVEFGEAARRLLYLGWFLALFWLAPRCVRGPEGLGKVVRALAAGAILAALVGLVQFALQFVVGALPMMWFWVQFVMPILEGERVAAAHLEHGTNWVLEIGSQPILRAIGPFSGPPDLAQYLAIVVPLSAAMLLQRPRIRARELAGPVVILLFLAFSFSRQAWVGIFLGFAVMIVLGSGQGTPGRERVSRRLGLLLASGVAAATLLVTLGSIQREGPLGAAVNRVQSILDPADTSNRERFATWSSALLLAEARPILGAGLGNYAVAVGDRRGAYSHNTYLDLLVEIGPLGLLGFLLLLGWAFTASARLARAGSEISTFGLGAAGAVVALGVIFFFDDAFFFPRAGQAFWLLLGLIASAERMRP